MAVTGGDASPKKGSAGPYSFYIRQGQTIMRKAHNRRSKKGRTPQNMASRTQMSNLISVWRAFEGGLKDCFEKAKAGSTDYTGYMSVNRRSACVYLTKEQAERHFQVADNLYVSSGTLEPSVGVEERGEWVVSDVETGLAEIKPDTRFYQVTGGIVRANNGAFHEGDELLFVRLTQELDRIEKRPEVDVRVNRLRLNSGDIRPWSQVLAEEGLEDGFQLVDGRLAAERRRNSLVAWVHLRRVSKERVLVTSQRLVGTNLLLREFTSDGAYLAAITSYGPFKRGTGSWNTATPLPPPPAPAPPSSYASILDAPVPQPQQAPEALTIALVASPAGAGSVLGGGTCLPGTELHLSAQAAPGYRFLSWEDGCTEASRVLKAERSDTLTAFFVRTNP